MRSYRTTLAVVTSLIVSLSTVHAQQPPAGGGRPIVGPVQNEFYRSSFVKLGGNAADGLLYEPAKLGVNAHVAVVYSNSNFNFDPPAAELARRGYRVLFVKHTLGKTPSPFRGFEEASRGITYLRAYPGVRTVVVAGWGSGATTMTSYADIAANGAKACQDEAVLYPCNAEQVRDLARPDGLILFDPGLGSGSKVTNVDPAYDGRSRSRTDLDKFASANGYDSSSGKANYSTEFRRKYFAAQSKRNNQIIDAALARLKELDNAGGEIPADEPFEAPAGVNTGAVASLHYSDLSLISRTKRPHALLKADGTQPVVILQSIRPSTGAVGADAIARLIAKNAGPARPGYTLREYLANDAIRTTDDFALTADDVVGVQWHSANTGTPAQAEGVSVPSLVMTNTCFQFVVASEIVFDHLAARDKTLAGVEGSEHFFTPGCGPQYGDTQKRLFDYVGSWLGKPGRF